LFRVWPGGLFLASRRRPPDHRRRYRRRCSNHSGGRLGSGKNARRRGDILPRPPAMCPSSQGLAIPTGEQRWESGQGAVSGVRVRTLQVNSSNVGGRMGPNKGAATGRWLYSGDGRRPHSFFRRTFTPLCGCVDRVHSRRIRGVVVARAVLAPRELPRNGLSTNTPAAGSHVRRWPRGGRCGRDSPRRRRSRLTVPSQDVLPVQATARSVIDACVSR
jgi:hypothetical protein